MSLSGFNIDTGTGATLPYRREQTTPELRALASIAAILVDQRALLERLLTTERTGAVSSVEIHFSNATKDVPSKPAPTIKVYAGSVPPVEEALEAYGRTVLIMEQAQVDGWKDTVDMLAAAKACTA